MNLETKKSGEIVVLKPLSNNIDSTVCSEFKARVIDLINQENNYFLLNLSQVDFIDSSGLGAIISILKTLNINNGDIVLSDVNPPVFNLFKLTRLNGVFKIYSTEKEGLDFFTNLNRS